MGRESSMTTPQRRGGPEGRAKRRGRTGDMGTGIIAPLLRSRKVEGTSFLSVSCAYYRDGSIGVSRNNFSVEFLKFPWQSGPNLGGSLSVLGG